MTEDVHEEITFTDDDISTAGLRPEGWYMFEVKSRRTQHIEAGIARKTGKPYDAFDVIKANLLSKARAFYTDTGDFRDTEDMQYGFPMSVDLDGSQYGLARLKGLYKAITEANLQGAGGVQSTLDELIGGQFWARLYHKKGTDGVTREELDTWRFRSRNFGPPQTVPVAQPAG